MDSSLNLQFRNAILNHLMKQKFVVGIDGGGTKTTAMVADTSGNVLAEDTKGPSNFQIIGIDQATDVLFSCVEECCKEAGATLPEVAALVAGLTGAGRPSDQERVKSALAARFKGSKLPLPSLIIESDARIALEGAFKGAGGIILIAGTGSIALGKIPEGKTLRVGGWGRILGDEGSGYAIGLQGLNCVTRELDGRGRKTFLTGLLADQFGLRDQEAIIREVYRNNFDIASLAPLIIKAAEQHDQESERILNRAAFELTEHVRALTFALEQATRGPRQKIPLSFVGSLLTQESIFMRIVKHKIEFSIPQITVVKPQAPPVYGAVLMACTLKGVV